MNNKEEWKLDLEHQSDTEIMSNSYVKWWVDIIKQLITKNDNIPKNLEVQLNSKLNNIIEIMEHINFSYGYNKTNYKVEKNTAELARQTISIPYNFKDIQITISQIQAIIYTLNLLVDDNISIRSIGDEVDAFVTDLYVYFKYKNIII
ncbi:MAG: hypothetical protein DRG78_00985 [Epsilonproteobacteria bacterium]|nr:MAG: hypothetical protein DRG78_00985 [Campylobacterota bacterium]